MSAPKNLILDVGCLVGLWLDDRRAQPAAELVALAEAGEIRLWVAAGSLPALELAACDGMEAAGIEPEHAKREVRRLMKKLLAVADVLTIHGFEQAEIYAAANDYRQAQIAAAARSLPGGNNCIVTGERTFDTLGEVPALSPEDALDWLREESAAPEVTDSAEIPFVDLTAQQRAIRPQIERRIEAALRHGRYVMGPEIGELEEKLADYVGVRHCIGVSSGTDALLIALMALEIGPGDEVITSAFSFVASAEAIALTGATPVFVDINPRTYNIEPERIETAISTATRAIMPVSLYGQCAEMDAINAIAERRGLAVIEDAAQSFGATYKGRRSCSLSTIGCTSFFPSKPLGGYGDSGACFTDDAALAKRMHEIRVHGQDRRYHHAVIGLNGRMDTLQAAILLPKLDRFPEEAAARARVGARYSRLFAENCDSPQCCQRGYEPGPTCPHGITVPWVAPDNTSVYAQYTIQVTNRDAVCQALQQRGIPTAVHYPMPLNQQPPFAVSADTAPPLLHSQAVSQRVLSLPMHAYSNASEQQRITKTVTDFVAAYR